MFRRLMGHAILGVSALSCGMPAPGVHFSSAACIIVRMEGSSAAPPTPFTRLLLENLELNDIPFLGYGASRRIQCEYIEFTRQRNYMPVDLSVDR
jgi:hypothetical protein